VREREGERERERVHRRRKRKEKKGKKKKRRRVAARGEARTAGARPPAAWPVALATVGPPPFIWGLHRERQKVLGGKRERKEREIFKRESF